MYQACVPTCSRALNNLAAILAKGAAHAETKKIDPAILVNARLYPDMFPLGRQVQIASDIAKAGAARLAGQQPPSWEDKEATFAELIERATRTVAFLEAFEPGQFDGAEDRVVTFKQRGVEKMLPGLVFLQHFVLPNVFFHAATAYDILRHNGVELGKTDFLGKI